MSFQISEKELEELQKNFGGLPVKLDQTINTAGENERVTTHVMYNGRIAHFVYHYSTDSITVFNVEEPAVQPQPEPIQRLTDFLNGNPDVKQLLGL